MTPPRLGPSTADHRALGITPEGTQENLVRKIQARRSCSRTLVCRPGLRVSSWARRGQSGISVGSRCNQVTALALNLCNAASGAEACGYFEYLEVMNSQQTQEAAKSYQLHTAYHCGGPLPDGARSTAGRLRLQCSCVFGGRVLNLIMEPLLEEHGSGDVHPGIIAVGGPIGTEGHLGWLVKPDRGTVAVRINEGHACGPHRGSNRFEVG